MKVFHSGPTRIALHRLGLCQHPFVFISLSILILNHVINISRFHNASFANGSMVLPVWGCPGLPTDLGSVRVEAVLQLKERWVLGESVPTLDSGFSSSDSAPSRLLCVLITMWGKATWAKLLVTAHQKIAEAIPREMKQAKLWGIAKNSLLFVRLFFF